MTSDGVDGIAAGCRPWARTPGSWFIKPDDGRFAERYIEPAYPHTPAAGHPQGLRRERQVAPALRNRTDFVTASLICGADGITGGPRAEARLRQGAIAAAGSRRAERPPPRPAKGSR